MDEGFDTNVVKLNLHTAALALSTRDKTHDKANGKCNCAGICKGDNRCSCFKESRKCTSHCHAKQAKANAKICCKNKDTNKN